VAAGEVEAAAAGDQAQLGGEGGVVDVVGGEAGLGVLLDPVDGEPGGGAVGPGHRDRVAGVQLAQPVEDRRAALGVDVAEQDRRARVARPGAAGPLVPAGLVPLVRPARHLDGAMAVPAEALQAGVDADRGDPQPDRHGGGPVGADRVEAADGVDPARFPGGHGGADAGVAGLAAAAAGQDGKGEHGHRQGGGGPPGPAPRHLTGGGGGRCRRRRSGSRRPAGSCP
jgi:hypothetical protein